MKQILMLAILALVAAGQGSNQAEVQLQAAIKAEVFDGNLKGAIARYQRIITTFSNDRPVVAKALVRMGQCYEKLGNADARKAYERVVREFADQKEAVEQARALLAAGGLTSQPEAGMIVQQKWVLPSGRQVEMRHVSADGRYIPYAESGSIWLHDLTTGEDRKVIEGKPGNETAASPNLSSDGKQVAYTWSGPGRKSGLRVSSINGSDTRVLMEDQARPPLPKAWSPDGTRILILQSTAAGDFSLAVVSAADGSVRVLTTEGHYSNGCFSPDSRFVVAYRGSWKAGQFVRAVAGLTLIPVDGSAPVPLFESSAANWAPFWAPDGRSIVFLSDRSGTIDLWSIRMSGNRPQGDPELVKREASSMDAAPVGFTRDGLFYYKTSHVQSDIYTAELDPVTGRVTSKPALLTQRFVGSVSPPVEWSPDRQFLVYVRTSYRELGYVQPRIVSLIVRSERTGEEREIARVPVLNALEQDMGGPQWLPDGRSLLTVGYENEPSLLRQTDILTGQSKVFLDLSGRPSLLGLAMPALSRDGKVLYYLQMTSKSGLLSRLFQGVVFQLMRRNMETGQEKELYRPPLIVSGAFLSPDGRQVAFLRIDDEEGPYSLMIMPAEGGTARELLRSKQNITGLTWTRDGRHLLMARESDSGPPQLWAVPIAGGEPQPSGLAMPGLSQVALHPDGRRVAFGSKTGPIEEVWVIKNLLSASKAQRR